MLSVDVTAEWWNISLISLTGLTSAALSFTQVSHAVCAIPLCVCVCVCKCLIVHLLQVKCKCIPKYTSSVYLFFADILHFFLSFHITVIVRHNVWKWICHFVSSTLTVWNVFRKRLTCPWSPCFQGEKFHLSAVCHAQMLLLLVSATRAVTSQFFGTGVCCSRGFAVVD